MSSGQEPLLSGNAHLHHRATMPDMSHQQNWNIDKEKLNRHNTLPAEVGGRDRNHVERAAFSGIIGRRLTVNMDDDHVTTEKQSNKEAVVNLLNNCLGSGLLSTAFAVSQAGLLVSLCCMVFFMFLNRFTILLNLRSCRLANCDPGTCQIGECTFGTAGRLFMTLLFVSQSYLVMVSYTDACVDGVDSLLDLFAEPSEQPSRNNLMFIVWVVLLAPTTLIRSMKSVAMLSFIAFLGGILLVVGVVTCCGELLSSQGTPALADVHMVPQSPSEFVNGLSIFVFMFAIQPGAAAVLSTMEDDSDANVRNVSWAAFLIVITLNVILGCGAYLALLSNTQGDLLLSFPSDLAPAIAARIAMVILVVLSYMIMSIPCKIAMIDLIFHKNEAKQEASAAQFYGFTFVLNILVLCLAMGVNDLSLILGVNGAVCCSFVALILPAVFYMRIRANPLMTGATPVPVLSGENVPYMLILLLGLVSLIICSYQVAQRFLGS